MPLPAPHVLLLFRCFSVCTPFLMSSQGTAVHSSAACLCWCCSACCPSPEPNVSYFLGEAAWQPGAPQSCTLCLEASLLAISFVPFLCPGSWAVSLGVWEGPYLLQAGLEPIPPLLTLPPTTSAVRLSLCDLPP